MRFSQLNPLGRVIIVTVAALTAGIAVVAFATSSGALYAFISDTGLYADSGRYAARLNQAWPLLLDAAFIVSELAAILFGILRGPRGWPILTMGVTGALTVWFNLQHAGADPGRRLAAVIPPILMMLAFQIDVAIVRAVMRYLGRPLEQAAPPLVHGASWRLDQPSDTHLKVGQTGQGFGSAVTKREHVQAYLDRLGPSAAVLTAREIKDDLAEQGVDVSEQYVNRVMAAGAARNGDRPG